MPVKTFYKYNLLRTSFVLRFAKALVALSCSGGVFYACNYLKLLINLKI